MCLVNLYKICLSFCTGYGKVQISVYNLQTKTVTKHVIRDDEMQSLKLQHVTVDMPTGRLTLGPSCDEMAETITLALCAGIMFLSCQKKAIMMPALNGSVKSLNKLKAFEAIDNNSNSASVTLNKPAPPTSRFNSKLKLQNRKRTRRRKISASFTFLLACGLQIDSYYYNNTSQPSSRNSTITLNDVPVVTNVDGDVKFAGNQVNGHTKSVTTNGFIMQERMPPEKEELVHDIRL